MDSLVELPAASTLGSPESKKNKWRSYRVGRHTPSQLLVQEINVRFPGSENLLNHSAWHTLRTDNEAEQQTAALMMQLPPASFPVIHKNAQSPGNQHFILDGWNKRRLRLLEQQVSLNNLATLVLLLRLAACAGRSQQAFEFGASVCRVLLMMGPWLITHGIARPLSDYLTEHVLVLGHHNGQHHCFRPEGFVCASHLLALTASNIEGDKNRRLTRYERASLLIDLLDDKFSTPFSDLVVTRPVSVAHGAALKNSRNRAS